MALCYDTNASANHAHDHRRPSGPELEHTISKLPAAMPPGTALELTSSKPVMLTDFSTYTISVGQFGPTDQPPMLVQTYAVGAVLVNWKSPREVEAVQCEAHPQEGPEGRPGNYRPDSKVGLILVPDKVMEQIISSPITQHIQDTQGITPTQQRFRKSRSCMANLISSIDWVTGSADERKSVDVST
ncbi:hypothetical protein HGM15179_012097 [Zosterops borbonicus]|uniref:Reverse transcriptase domain-containing protein n=1 Tax=Zosterops borbonicus TaxID=364589 RepID=A0A8K1GAF2_9PASS|nr:hypothetical protein HGM15179_012097 [Zosterops borbonicus]